VSDMNESDIAPDAPADAPAAEPAPEQPEAEAPENDEAAEQTPEAVPVLAQVPSSDPTHDPNTEVAEEAPVSLEDAARVVVIYVKAHRTIGDADLAAAVADVEAALTAQA
jgi:hypothetical protein